LAEIQLAAQTAPRPSPMTLGQRAQELNYGLGRGFTNILEGNLGLAQALYQDPRAVGSAFANAARQFAANPVDTVGNSLRGMWNRAKSSPAGLGEVIGENIDPRNFLKPRKALRKELDVYHGTPYQFEPEEGAPLGRFRSEKIGTGEGQQAFGYGLYLAENPDVANQYRINPQNFAPELKNVLPPSFKGKAADWANEIQNGKTFSDIFAAANSQREKNILLQTKPEIEKLINRQKTGGFKYKIDLPDAKIEQMLDWDKPLNQQPASVRAAINGLVEAEEIDIGKYGSRFRDGSYTAGEAIEIFNEVLGGPKMVSSYLKQSGIPGIKYFDHNSRTDKKGTRNFVVFPGEEQSLNILSRD
jgi:hypothetical protein